MHNVCALGIEASWVLIARAEPSRASQLEWTSRAELGRELSAQAETEPEFKPCIKKLRSNSIFMYKILLKIIKRSSYILFEEKSRQLFSKFGLFPIGL